MSGCELSLLSASKRSKSALLSALSTKMSSEGEVLRKLDEVQCLNNLCF